ncbi:hypothetical protein SAMN05660462_01106 [Proteiniborus ethanoligenes]|uniref:DUF6199 domain-containing protein n=1 Tax=Proteiniborus ethanoligenes TaxID=415015 RepID=A0A1H3NFQ7_9FIRM|nr:DUF6199 family natural product biosynthesis protein [Proteiniborus ethanoligenes]SDY87761.1 hypothetical protein SAMN05660462_01106 [Proteiniborus ethanoligenes]
MKIIASIILIIGIINPRLTWKVSEGWKFKDAEPSEAYLIMSRIVSVIVLIIVWLFVE